MYFIPENPQRLDAGASPTFFEITSGDGSHFLTYLEYLYLEGLVDF